MDEIVGRVPVFVTRAGQVFGPQQTKGVCASFVIDPQRPDYVAICTRDLILWVSRYTLTAGLELRTLEPSGDVAVRPYEADEVTWVVVDVDRPAFPARQISARLAVVQAFLLVAGDLLDFADPDAFERMVPRPERGGDWDVEPPVRPLRSDGGAA